MKTKRLTAVLVLVAILSLFVTGFGTEDTPASINSPVFLNGESEYLTTCDTDFSNILTTAVKNATGAHISLIAAGQINSSLQAGEVTRAQVEAALNDDPLIVTTMSVKEIKELLDDNMLFGSESFPHFAGLELRAEKYLNADGDFAARVVSLMADGEELSDSELLNVAVTSGIYAGEYGYAFISTATSTDYTLASAFMEYMSQTDDATISAVGQELRSIISSDTIDTEDVITKLSLDVPSPVYIGLNNYATVPDTIFYALKGQNRNLVCMVMGGDLPYSFIFNGLNINSPQNVSLYANVTQTLPRGRRAASSADREAVFADLANNTSLPNGSVLTIEIASVYPPETVLYLYYYDSIGDISAVTERNEALMVNTDGAVSFQAGAGTTYLMNSRPLNEASFFETPTPENPFTEGIILILVLFTAWVVLFFVRKGVKKAKSA